ncbi:MAG: DUF2147 domain-containing protein [Flavobacteriales bacterium]|nr:DUF2147 domain-containing protein [Flavobacteriales bacterium]
MNSIHFKTTLFFLTFVFALFSGVQAQDKNEIVDSWLTGEERSHIEIFKKGDKFYGKIAWIKEPNDPETGKPKTADNGDGTIYDPEAGKTYYCSIEMDGDDKIKIRGSVDPMGWLGRTEVWTRVKK